MRKLSEYHKTIPKTSLEHMSLTLSALFPPHVSDGIYHYPGSHTTLKLLSGV